MENQKNKFWKFTLIFFAIIAGVFVLYIACSWGWYFFRQWQGEKAVEELVGRLERIKQEDYQKAMADTYGGRIPQETLLMYIDAVEKRNYELASKYFIEKYQDKELKSLQNSSEENIRIMIVQLREVLKNEGSFSWDRTGFAIRKPILVDFILYSNNVWKIVRI